MTLQRSEELSLAHSVELWSHPQRGSIPVRARAA